MSPRAGGPPPLVIVGPTASGKSAVAMELARRLISAGRPTELVSADSMQVYRGMDIGTAKPPTADRAEVPHHLIDVADPCHEYSVAEFLGDARHALVDIARRGAVAIVVGGTGLYLQALVDDFDIPGRYPDVRNDIESESDTLALHDRLIAVDPVAAQRMEPMNRRRIVRALEVTLGSGRPFSSFGPGLGEFPPTPFRIVGIDIDRDLLTERITSRLEDQIRQGFVEEVESLQMGSTISRTAAQALGYRELSAHLRGEVTLQEALSTTALRSRQFAVRQIKWFRRDPRIEWFSYESDPMEMVTAIENHWLRTAVSENMGRNHADL